LWAPDPAWQVFANVSRSAEIPTYDANSFATPASADLDAQRATTWEIGTRGARGDVRWDVSVYRARIAGELQCVTTAPWSPCTVVNADRTVHQGVEAGLDLTILDSAFAADDRLELSAAYTYSDFAFDGDATY